VSSEGVPVRTGPKLMEQLSRAVRARRYSPRTEEAYSAWVRRYVRFHDLRHPDQLGHEEVNQFLTHLVVDRKSSGSTQAQARAALMFLYKEVLRRPLGPIGDPDDIVRGKNSRKLPTVLTRKETGLVLREVKAVQGLVACVLYGSGLRLNEGLKLRLKDLDLERRELRVRDAKGGRQRVSVIPSALTVRLQEQMERRRVHHDSDCVQDSGWAVLRVRSGHASPQEGDEHWIIKFDGVTRSSGGQENKVTDEGGPWGRLEYVYSMLAKRAGIEMAETHLLTGQNGLAHFMTRRFDRGASTPGGKVHMHTLGGMMHLDYNEQYQIGYEDYFDVIRELGLSQPAVVEAYRRMVFSLATVNYDDHLKNFAFLMDAAGDWSLSPAYDVAFAENDSWTSQHQMSVAGKFFDVTRNDCLRVASSFDMRDRHANEIIDEVLDAVSFWDSEASSVGLAREFRVKMLARLEKERTLLQPSP
jgi:integrase